MKTYADMDAGEIAANFVVNLEDTLFKLKSYASQNGKDDRFIFDVATVALVDLLGQHLAKDRDVASDEYMLAVHQKLCDMVKVPKPALTLVGGTD